MDLFLCIYMYICRYYITLKQKGKGFLLSYLETVTPKVRSGHRVAGCDAGVTSPMMIFLAETGQLIDVCI